MLALRHNMYCTPNGVGISHNQTYSSIVYPEYHEWNTDKYPRVPHEHTSGDIVSNTKM